MRILLCEPTTNTIERGSDNLLERWRACPGAIVWLDFGNVSDEHRQRLLEGEFGLHPLAIQDALRQRHPPKVERFEHVLFLILRELNVEISDIGLSYIGVSMFIGPNYLVTRRTGSSASIDELWDKLSPDSPELESPNTLALDLIDRIVRRYLPILLGLEPRLNSLENDIFADSDDAHLEELTTMKTQLKELRRIFTYHGLVLKQLARLPNLELGSRYEHELIDAVEQVERSASLADLYYEQASDLTDAYLGLSAHRLNQVMKVLTVITVIFVPLSFLAGIYGMNFDNMPELHTRKGYFVLLSIMACIVAIQIYLFRRRKWL